MGQGTPGGMGKQGGAPGDRNKPGGDSDKKDKKFEPPAAPSRVGRKQRRQKGPEAASRLPHAAPLSKCRLRLLKLERVKDYLLMEEEFVAAQERLRPTEEKMEEDRSKVDDLRGTPMSVGSLEEIKEQIKERTQRNPGPQTLSGSILLHLLGMLILLMEGLLACVFAVLFIMILYLEKKTRQRRVSAATSCVTQNRVTKFRSQAPQEK